VPFAIETHGGVGPQAKEFMRKMAWFAQEHGILTSAAELVRDLYAAIACIVQRGNDGVVHTAWVRATGERGTFSLDLVRRVAFLALMDGTG
jgi:hypothetical protein